MDINEIAIYKLIVTTMIWVNWKKTRNKTIAAQQLKNIYINLSLKGSYSSWDCSSFLILFLFFSFCLVHLLFFYSSSKDIAVSNSNIHLNYVNSRKFGCPQIFKAGNGFSPRIFWHIWWKCEEKNHRKSPIHLIYVPKNVFDFFLLLYSKEISHDSLSTWISFFFTLQFLYRPQMHLE